MLHRRFKQTQSLEARLAEEAKRPRDESVRRLWKELLALCKVVKDAEADLPNPPCRIRPTTNGTARLRPRRGPRKPRSN